MATISVKQTHAGTRNRGSKGGIHEGRTAATIVRRLFGPLAEIEWYGDEDFTGRVLRYRAYAEETLADVELIDGNRS